MWLCVNLGMPVIINNIMTSISSGNIYLTPSVVPVSATRRKWSGHPWSLVDYLAWIVCTSTSSANMTWRWTSGEERIWRFLLGKFSHWKSCNCYKNGNFAITCRAILNPRHNDLSAEETLVPPKGLYDTITVGFINRLIGVNTIIMTSTKTA